MKAIPRKFNNAILLISAGVAYLSWMYFDVLSRAMQFGQANLTMYYLFKILLGLLVAIGTYNVLMTLARFLLRKNTLCLRLMFGKHYLRGEWVGFHKSNNELRMIILGFDQSMEEIKVKGISYSTAGNLLGYCTWENVFVNTATDVVSCGFVENNIKRNAITRGYITLNMQFDLGGKFARQMLGSFYEEHVDQVVNTVFYRMPDKAVFKSLSEKIDYINAQYTGEAYRILSYSQPEPDFYEAQPMDGVAGWDAAPGYAQPGFEQPGYEQAGYDPGQPPPPGYDMKYVAK